MVDPTRQLNSSTMARMRTFNNSSPTRDSFSLRSTTTWITQSHTQPLHSCYFSMCCWCLFQCQTKRKNFTKNENKNEKGGEMVLFDFVVCMCYVCTLFSSSLSVSIFVCQYPQSLSFAAKHWGHPHQCPHSAPSSHSLTSWWLELGHTGDSFATIQLFHFAIPNQRLIFGEVSQ